MPKLSIHEHKLLITAGMFCTFAYLYLANTTQNYDQPSLVEFWSISGACALTSFALCANYQLRSIQISIPLMLGFAFLFRVIGIWGLPIFEDDFYRYLWDGRMLVEFGSPYGLAPADFFDSNKVNEDFDHILSNINHPQIATVYGPFCQWIFALAYLMAPGEIWPLQLIFGGADIVIVLMLLKLAKPNWVLLYAWSPLMIKEFAFTAHPDVVGVAMLLAALLMIKREQWLLAAMLLALAAATKVFALILVPFLLGLRIRAWSVFGFTAILVALPFGLIAAWMPEGLSAMTEGWLFNAPIYYFLSQWSSIASIKIVLMGIFVLFWGGYLAKVTFFNRKAPVRADYLYGLFLLCIPVLNSWYLVWLLPFAVMYPSASAWAASFSLLLAYGTGLNMPNSELDLYQQPTPVLILEFLIIFTALTWDMLNRISTKRPI